MNRFKGNYFVVDEGDCYNAFDLDMFDKDGYLEGHKGEAGYHLDDYDIIHWFDDFDAAHDYAEMLNDNL